VSVVPSQASADLCSFHHWHHHSPASSFVIPTSLTLDDVRHIFAFRELGSFTIPTSQSSPQDRHAYLSSRAETASQDGDGDQAIIQSILGSLTPAAPAHDAAELQLFSVEVATRAEDGLADGNVAAMVWNWAKPTSLYLPRGTWSATVSEAVVDGVWRAGMGFVVQVERVGEEGRRDMFKRGSWVMVPRDPEDAEVFSSDW
jgi:hypothetical protein